MHAMETLRSINLALYTIEGDLPIYEVTIARFYCTLQSAREDMESHLNQTDPPTFLCRVREQCLK